MDGRAAVHRWISILWCTAAYVAAGSVAFLVVRGSSPEQPPLGVLAVADLAAMMVVFAFSVAFDNSSFYDPYWSVAPMGMAGFWLLGPPAGTVDAFRATLCVGLVLLWGVRLTHNWVRGWSGADHEDWRYRDMRPKAGRAYWLLSLLGFHLMPTALVFVGCLPLAFALTSPAPLGPLGLAGGFVTLGAIAIEGIADEQLRSFRAHRSDPSETLTTGLWRYSRHPNYFGEWLFWFGLFLIGLDADAGAWWTAIGPLVMLWLFVFISIPLIEARMLLRKAGYEERAKRVSSFVPWPP